VRGFGSLQARELRVREEAGMEVHIYVGRTAGKGEMFSLVGHGACACDCEFCVN
jgi:hypothetical protein